MNEYEAHLSSYDHSHKQRMKDMKAMVRDPNATARARKQEAKAEGVISIKLGEGNGGGATGGASGGGFKKGGFKKSGFKSAFAPVAGETAAAPINTSQKEAATGGSTITSAAAIRSELVASDTDDEGYEMYDPRFPTD